MTGSSWVPTTGEELQVLIVMRSGEMRAYQVSPDQYAVLGPTFAMRCPPDQAEPSFGPAIEPLGFYPAVPGPPVAWQRRVFALKRMHKEGRWLVYLEVVDYEGWAPEMRW